MKAKFGNQLVLACGMHNVIDCVSKQQALDNITKWKNAVQDNETFITFCCLTGELNVTIVSEIVSMSVMDFEYMKRITREQHIEHSRMMKDVEREVDHDSDFNPHDE